MASVRKSITSKGTTRWQAVWQEPAPGGKTQRRTRNFGSQKEAREHAQRQEREVERRGVGDPQKHSLERYLKRWLATLTERGEHSPTTLWAYRRQSALACRHIGHIALEKLSPADLDGLYALLLRRGGVTHERSGRQHGRSTRARCCTSTACLHTALEQARKWKMISENPAKDATAPTPRRSSLKAFTQDEVARLLDAAARDRETFIIVSTLLITGIRRSELLGLAIDAIDLDAGTLTIKRVILEVEHAPLLREDTKSDSSARTLSIPPLLVDLLREQKARVLEAALAWGKGYRREPMFLFCRPDGEPLNPQILTVRLRKVMRAPASPGGHRPMAGVIPRPPSWSAAAPTSRRSRPGSATRRRRSRWRSTSTPPPSATRPPASSSPT